MSEMLDRVEQAIKARAEERGHPVDPLVVRHVAVAAIEAMRDPTDDMIEAGRDNNPTQWVEGTERGFATDVVNDVWRGMVRAALAQ